MFRKLLFCLFLVMTVALFPQAKSCIALQNDSSYISSGAGGVFKENMNVCEYNGKIYFTKGYYKYWQHRTQLICWDPKMNKTNIISDENGWIGNPIISNDVIFYMRSKGYFWTNQIIRMDIKGNNKTILSNNFSGIPFASGNGVLYVLDKDKDTDKYVINKFNNEGVFIDPFMSVLERENCNTNRLIYSLENGDFWIIYDPTDNVFIETILPKNVRFETIGDKYGMQYSVNNTNQFNIFSITQKEEWTQRTIVLDFLCDKISGQFYQNELYLLLKVSEDNQGKNGYFSGIIRYDIEQDKEEIVTELSPNGPYHVVNDMLIMPLTNSPLPLEEDVSDINIYYIKLNNCNYVWEEIPRPN